MDEQIFTTDDGEIFWRYAEASDLLYYQEPTTKPILIEFIQAETQGQGQGKKLMMAFIAKMKKENVDLIYLYASYDSANFDEEQDATIGHRRLIKFYEDFGFEVLAGELGEGFQVDMALELI